MKFGKLFLFLILVFSLYFVARYFYMKPNVIRGENAPAVTGTLLNGEPFDLVDLKGKYVLVDFWGSWCGPCLKEMPAIKGLYQKYQSAQFKEANGLAILSIAIERNESRWKRAVERIGMPWKYHLADITTSFKFINSPLAEEFGVKQVPSKFLLNEKGVIIGVNQSVEELDIFLEKRLK